MINPFADLLEDESQEDVVNPFADIEPPKDEYTFKEAAGGLLDSVSDVPTHLKGSIARAIEGTDPYSSRNFLDEWREESERVQRETGEKEAAKASPGEKFGIFSPEDISGFGSNLAFSGTAGGAGLVGAAAGSIVKAPWIGGGIGTGAAAQRMAANQFLTNAVGTIDDAAKEQGIELTDDQRMAAAKELSDLANASGWWEAIPETVGNLTGLKVIATPLKGAFARMLGDNIASNALKKLGALYGVELATETVTQTGQHNVDVEAGLSDEAAREFGSPSDLGTSFAEVAPATLLTTTAMAGAGAAGVGAYRAGKKLKGINPFSDIVESSLPAERPDSDLATEPRGFADLAPQTGLSTAGLPSADAGIATAAPGYQPKSLIRDFIDQTAVDIAKQKKTLQSVGQQNQEFINRVYGDQPFAGQETQGPSRVIPNVMPETPVTEMRRRGYDDPRLENPDYAQAVQRVATTDFEEGGGIGLVPDESTSYMGPEGRVIPGKKRTSSVHSAWARGLLDSEGVSVKQVRKIAQKVADGKRLLGDRQKRVLKALLDRVDGIEEGREVDQDILAYEQSPEFDPFDPEYLTAIGAQDTYDLFYDEALSGDGATIAAKAAQVSKVIDPDQVEALIERLAIQEADTATILNQLEELKDEAQRGQKQEPGTRGAGLSQEGAAAEAQAELVSENKPGKARQPEKAAQADEGAKPSARDFRQTHEAPDGTPLQATEEPDVYVDVAGEEWIEPDATLIKEGKQDGRTGQVKPESVEGATDAGTDDAGGVGDVVRVRPGGELPGGRGGPAGKSVESGGETALADGEGRGEGELVTPKPKDANISDSELVSAVLFGGRELTPGQIHFVARSLGLDNISKGNRRSIKGRAVKHGLINEDGTVNTKSLSSSQRKTLSNAVNKDLPKEKERINALSDGIINKLQRALDPDSLPANLEALAKQEDAAAADWANRKYKKNKIKVELRGDGPANVPEMSIGTINERRKQKAIRQHNKTANLLRNLAKRDSNELLNEYINLKKQVDGYPQEELDRFKASREQMLEMEIGRVILGDDVSMYGPKSPGGIVRRALGTEAAKKEAADKAEADNEKADRERYESLSQEEKDAEWLKILTDMGIPVDEGATVKAPTSTKKEPKQEKKPDSAKTEELKVGDKTFFRGDEVTITTEPYEAHGGMFQDATLEDGRIVSIATKGQREKDVAKSRQERKEQQEGFRRLREGKEKTEPQPEAEAKKPLNKIRIGKPENVTLPDGTEAVLFPPSADQVINDIDAQLNDLYALVECLG